MRRRPSPGQLTMRGAADEAVAAKAEPSPRRRPFPRPSASPHVRSRSPGPAAAVAVRGGEGEGEGRGRGKGQGGCRGRGLLRRDHPWQARGDALGRMPAQANARRAKKERRFQRPLNISFC